MIKYALAAGILLAGVSTLSLTAEAKARCAPGEMFRVSKGICMAKADFYKSIAHDRLARAQRKAARVAARRKPANAAEAVNLAAPQDAAEQIVAYIPGTSLEGIPGTGVPVTAAMDLSATDALALAPEPRQTKRAHAGHAATPKVEKVAKVEKAKAIEAPAEQEQAEATQAVETPVGSRGSSLKLVKSIKVTGPKIEPVVRQTAPIIAPAPQQQTSSPFGALVPVTTD